jgi:hypothetical protein
VVGGYKGTGGEVACPTGTTTTTAGNTAVDSTACNNLDPGYYYTGVAGIAPAQISSNNVLVCTKGFWCDGNTAITTLSLVTGRTTCVDGTTTASAAITNIAATDCTILLPTWYHNGFAAVVDATTIMSCAANGYCPGSCTTGTCIAETYSASATSGIINCPGYECVIATGSGLHAACTAQTTTTPNGGSGTTAGGQFSINGCINLDAGWYYDPGTTKQITQTGASPATIKPCPADNWCDGTATITLLSASAGISGTCPTAGSTSPAGSDAAEDCVLVSGYYYTGIGGVLNQNTIQPCKPGAYFCDAPFSGAFTIDGTEQGLSACGAGTTCTLGTLCTQLINCT